MNEKTVFYVNLSLVPFNLQVLEAETIRLLESGKIDENEAYDKNVRIKPVKYKFAPDLEKVNPVYGFQTNEPALKSILQICPVDELIIVASEEVYRNSFYQADAGSVSSKKDAVSFPVTQIPDIEDLPDSPSTLDYFISEMNSYCQNVLKEKDIFACVKNISVYPMDNSPSREQMNDRALEIARRIMSLSTSGTRVRLFIDSNGGKREMMIIQLAIIRALETGGIEAEMVLYSDFVRGKKYLGGTMCEIVDKKLEYKIFDIVSGIDEFIEYGRAYKLADYFNDTDPDSPITPILDSINTMCRVFTTCFADPMVESVERVVKSINEFQSSSVLENYIVSQISADLGEQLLHAEGSKSILHIIDWCHKKKFTQQALTLYVEKLPLWYGAVDIIEDKYVSDFYQSAFKNTAEEKFYQEIEKLKNETEQLMNPWQTDNVEKTSYVVQELKKLPENKYILLAIKELPLNYDERGSRVASPGSSGKPKTIEIYLNVLKDHLKRSGKTQLYTAVNRIQNNLTGLASSHAKANTANIRAYVLDRLHSLEACDELYLDPTKMAKIYSDIKNSYDVSGTRISAKTNAPIEFSQFLTKGKLAYSKLFIQDAVEKESIPDSKDSDVRTHTYIQKRRGIINLTESRKNKLLPKKAREKISLAELKKLEQFYLAIKMIRNNTNHSAGNVDKNTKLVFEWLEGEGILSLSGHVNGDTITLDYNLINSLLKDAMDFNKGIEALIS